MRIIVTARQTLTPVYQQVLQRLVTILGVIAKNPSNPNFDQYIFESISALLRYVFASYQEPWPTLFAGLLWVVHLPLCLRSSRRSLALSRLFFNRT